MLYIVYKIFRVLFSTVDKKICSRECYCGCDYVCYTCEDKWNNS